MAELLYKEESYIIQGGAYELYKKFRNRHKETVYQRAYYFYLEEKGLQVEKEKQIPIYFNNKKVGIYTPDLVINNAIFIELKCKPMLTKDDIKQFWYYLKASDYKLGYLINFGAINGVQIVRRVYDTARSKI
jgi:GxxExxY protein